MSTVQRAIILVLTMCVLGACSKAAAPQRAATQVESGRVALPVTHAAGFVNRVWKVKRSTAVEAGTLYVFLSDGTLVITSAHSKPLLGSWSRSGAELSMVEESIPYRVEILRLTNDSFEIRSHNPGSPVDIEMSPADVAEP
jgi:hypothetical protein